MRLQNLGPVVSLLFHLSHFGNSQTVEIIYVDKFRKSFGMVFPIVTKLLPNDERLFYPGPWLKKLLLPNFRTILSRRRFTAQSIQWMVGWTGGGWVFPTLGYVFRVSPFSASPLLSFSTWLFHLQTDGWNLDVAIDVEAIVFWGQHYRAIVHQGHVEALGVFHLVMIQFFNDISFSVKSV